MNYQIDYYSFLADSYFSSIPGHLHGFRKNENRLFWMAWDKIGHDFKVIFNGVMDDFGNLVETKPYP